MFPELSSDLERRAALHGALADPARLQITDTLLAGDASPSELAAMLAIPPYRPVRTRHERSIPAPSPPPSGTACRCPGYGPVT